MVGAWVRCVGLNPQRLSVIREVSRHPIERLPQELPDRSCRHKPRIRVYGAGESLWPNSGLDYLGRPAGMAHCT